YPALGTDEWIALSVVDEAQWRDLAALLGRSDWLDDAQLADLSRRHEAHDRIDAGIVEWTATRAADDAVEQLQSAGSPAEVVIRPRDIASNVQVRHRMLFEPEHHPLGGDIEVPVLPFRLSGVDRWVRRPCPLRGEHNAEVLTEVAT